MSSIEAENVAGSSLLASLDALGVFSTKSDGITDILICSSNYVEVSTGSLALIYAL
jgi:hypothetical protein